MVEQLFLYTYVFLIIIILQTINITWTKFNHINLTIFDKVKYLKVLDLRWNKLENFPFVPMKNVDNLFLAGKLYFK